VKAEFGNNAVFVMGNFSMPSVKHQASSLGIGMRRLLSENGFNILLIDEYATSSYCPLVQK
jgi:hypothetical protein